MRRPPCQLGLLATFGLACVRDPTQVILVVDSEIPWGPGREIQSLFVTVRAGGPEGEAGQADAWPVNADVPLRLPMTIRLSPRTEASAPLVWVELLGCPGTSGCGPAAGGQPPVATQRVLVGYEAEATRRVEVLLSAACRGLVCPASQTCDAASGRCRSALVPPGVRSVAVPRSDGAAPYDGAVDASVDVGDVPDEADRAAPDDVADRCGDLRCDASESCGTCARDCGSCVTQRSCPNDHEFGCGAFVIEGGTFAMGADSDCVARKFDVSRCAVAGAPRQRTLSVSAFAMDRYEVTVARFRRFWSDAAARAAPPATVRYPAGDLPLEGVLQSDEQLVGCSAGTWRPVPGERETAPLTCVSWVTAQAFCAWDGGRLPTEAEWEFAARTAEGRLHPWGDAEPDMTRACWSAGSDLRNQPCLVTTHILDEAASGVNGLAGNVMEWTADVYQPYAEVACWGDMARRDPLCREGGDGGVSTRTIRGGSWGTRNPWHLRGAARFSAAAIDRYNNLGFRCVRGVGR